MIYGYARISTAQQSIERQIRNISKAYPEAKIFSEAYTGTKISRPQFDKLLNKVKSGDTIVFDSVSRMSRNAEEGFNVYKDLFNKGVSLEFLKEPQINTETYKKALQNTLPTTNTAIDYIIEGIEKYLLAVAEEQIKIAFSQAQKEVDDLRQRTKEGMQTAKLNGKQIGRAEGDKLTTQKSTDAKAKILKLSADFGGSFTDKECIQMLGVCRNSFYKYKAELRGEAV